VYIEYLTHEYFIRQLPVSTLSENDCVGIERVGGPLSADVEESFENQAFAFCPSPMSPFPALIYSIFLLPFVLLLFCKDAFGF
jgi:hypothetical protein